jgi:hypothetical protein
MDEMMHIYYRRKANSSRKTLRLIYFLKNYKVPIYAHIVSALSREKALFAHYQMKKEQTFNRQEHLPYYKEDCHEF